MTTHEPKAPQTTDPSQATCKDVGRFVMGPGFWDVLNEPGYEARTTAEEISVVCAD